MSDCQDMTTALARELTSGIKNEVEDLGAVFKKMAILKPVVDIEQVAADVTEGNAVAITAGNSVHTDTAAQSARERDRNDRFKLPAQSSGLLSLLHNPKPKKAPKKKSALIAEGQLSLFDLAEDTA
jgi:hypothetical protein